MARPRKTGLDYFSLDVDFDEKVDAIEIQFGNDGFAVFVKSLQSCYKTEDGEFDCSEVFRRTTAAKRANVSVERWLEIVQYAADIGLFSKKDWDERKVITSQGIKKRIDAVSADRKAARLRKEASRHSPSPTPPPLKAKKRKVKESKGNPPLSGETQELFGEQLPNNSKERGVTKIIELSDDAPLPPELSGHLSRTHAEQWIAFKFEMGKPYTPRGFTMLMTQWASRGETRFVAAVQHSIASNYQGLYEPPEERVSSGKPMSRNEKQKAKFDDWEKRLTEEDYAKT